MLFTIKSCSFVIKSWELKSWNLSSWLNYPSDKELTTKRASLWKVIRCKETALSVTEFSRWAEIYTPLPTFLSILFLGVKTNPKHCLHGSASNIWREQTCLCPHVLFWYETFLSSYDIVSIPVLILLAPLLGDLVKRRPQNWTLHSVLGPKKQRVWKNNSSISASIYIHFFFFF